MAFVESPTEARNPRTLDIDTLSTAEVLRRIADEDALVPAAVAAAVPELARAVDLAVGALRGGGRLHYFGSGTSGRIAAQDAAELPPTFGVEPELVVAHHAGGVGALLRATEGVEDDEAQGARDAAEVTGADLAVGLAASGRTPYVAGALRTAARAGAPTVLLTANPAAELGRSVDVLVALDTGPEVLAGSTRMKAGSAQKMALNAFSTAVMIRLGRTYSNLMVAMNATNAKLRGRAVTMLAQASGAGLDACADVLERSGGDTRVALVSLLAEVPVEAAAEAVGAAGGSVRAALRRLVEP
ncbi:N-acetylmuramic acid 6-phosphate etherase [Allonocardiopsis opalescens]|nr:N-acetylmuramic acid 6-phosphate etherase [Allonocardiopsis opalescens]